jgi:hypothetical protein
MKTFKQYVEYKNDTDNPINTKTHLSTQTDKELLQAYINKGVISKNDVDDIDKMLSQGWSFQDALSAIQQQANQRNANNFARNYMPADNRRKGRI